MRIRALAAAAALTFTLAACSSADADDTTLEAEATETATVVETTETTATATADVDTVTESPEPEPTEEAPSVVAQLEAGEVTLTGIPEDWTVAESQFETMLLEVQFNAFPTAIGSAYVADVAVGGDAKAQVEGAAYGMSGGLADTTDYVVEYTDGQVPGYYAYVPGSEDPLLNAFEIYAFDHGDAVIVISASYMDALEADADFSATLAETAQTITLG
ncbi:hypothetical protein [Demequina mangrovi]|uniref:Lipoprotein LpqN n=1 Tax=Demequina mangrovi TaxID=1043493 RepID=A0A1H7AN20_9MICO|nr:hypothetical protein [Demequina mangrovi]SEJ63270.1 hypothetical protein SAMN05421637_2490 [Demequina mangrovi]